MKKFFVGTSGFHYRDWKEIFYPKGLKGSEELLYYSKFFDTIEINATFYRGFPPSVFTNWREKTNSDFCFTLKGSRYITHIRRINQVEEEVKRFYQSAECLKNKLSLTLWQFPASFKYTDENMERILTFFTLLPQNIRQAFELRSDTWFNADFFKYLDKYGYGFVINDSRRFPEEERITGRFAYIRFHGPASLYSSSYSGRQLGDWSKKIKRFLKKYDVFCYFNNDVQGYAVKNALKLKELVKGPS